jgi:hypothetical protein
MGIILSIIAIYIFFSLILPLFIAVFAFGALAIERFVILVFDGIEKAIKACRGL